MKKSKKNFDPLLGTLVLRNWVIESADVGALHILKKTGDVLGKRINSILPCYEKAAFTEKPKCQFVTINSTCLILTTLKYGNTRGSCLVLLNCLEIHNPFMDALFSEKLYDKLHSIFDSMHESTVIVDKNGLILRVSKTFKELYDLEVDNAIGKTVYELEAKKFFSPSVLIDVLNIKKPNTLTMKTKLGRYVVATGVPIFDGGGNLEGAISFLRDADDYAILKEQYEILENKIKHYSTELKELREKEMNFPEIISKSKKMKECLTLSLKVARVDTNLTITGESGVGKNLIAREIHKKSHRVEGPFIEISCGAIPENLLESELFGYETGAFTGAHKKGKIGMIELAHGGTLFLDEIGELSLALQVKLLKVLQEKSLVRLGGGKEIKVDFRLITATNKNLEHQIKSGEFRKDLYYRINVIPIDIPPLRDRTEDVLPLIVHFLNKANVEYQLNANLSSKALDHLMAYSWPGNVREIQNMMERLVVTTGNETIRSDHLPDFLKNPCFDFVEKSTTLKEAIELFEKQIISKAYNLHGSSVGVARALGIGQTSAARKLRKFLPGYTSRRQDLSAKPD